MNKNKKGFTLIEVILVLAIGSMIFAMAFIAYSQASANRRDTQRRADLGKIASELENYAADNNGKYPEKFTYFATGSYETDFIPNYISALKDPSGTVYPSIASGQPGFLEYLPSRIGAGYAPTKFCDGTDLISGARDYVVRMKLEKGDTCRDSKQ